MTETADPYALSDEHALLRATVRRLAEEKIAPHAARADELAEFPQEAYQALVSSGFQAVHIPTSYGGQGADLLSACIVVEEVARCCAATSLIPSVNGVATWPLIMAGSEELRKRYLPPVATEGALFSYALSEPDAGSDSAAIRTRAVRDGDHYVLTGTKRWITHAGWSRFYLVFAVTDPDATSGRGISAFVVEKDDPGISFGAPERKMGLRGSPTCEVHLDGVRVPAGRMVGAEGSGYRTAMAALERSRLTIAAQAVGIAQGALDHAVGYVRERTQFGQPISQFQGVQFIVADAVMKIEAARALTYSAAVRCERGDPAIRTLSAAAKCLASDTAMQVTTDAVQLLGGYGYVRDHPVERMMRDAKVTQIYEGTNQIQRMVIGRQALR